MLIEDSHVGVKFDTALHPNLLNLTGFHIHLQLKHITKRVDCIVKKSSETYQVLILRERKI